MSGYGITPEEMAKAAVDVDNVNEESRNALSTLRGNLAPLHDNWRGQASAAFATLMNRFDEDARKLHDALQGISEQLKASNQAYVRQEEEASSSLSNITNVLG
ncbi:WXG100 family type VII secretion target [Actinokineospora enzanensis]|uniref:WXG100 family type VII secretion target n=1 Tax=Actinokineospora enzanensis TaxID=155975 RepID=UPI000361372B|nr:WXG100 family type VII secretion target [Actinokineospora enzanensis]